MTKTTTATAVAFATFAAAFIGREVEVSTDDTPQIFKIAHLDTERTGSLKDGTKGEYVVLQNAADEAIVLSLHPQKAKALMTKGEFENMKLVAEAAAAPKAKRAKKEKAAKAPEADTAVEPKDPSKKELFMAVYRAGVEAGKTRKEIKADAAALGLTDAGFNTYYQNAKSGKWA